MEIKKIEIENKETEVKPKRRLVTKKLLLILGIFLVFLILAVGIPCLMVVSKVRVVMAETQKLEEAAKTKDLKVIEQRVKLMRESLVGLERSVNLLSWTGFVPFIGNYQKDAVHLIRAGEAGLDTGEIVIDSVSPYADILGFSGGSQAQSGQKTAEDRIGFIVGTLDKITPDIDKIAEKAKIAKEEINQVDPNRYPEDFRGQKIREQLTKLATIVNEVAAITGEAKPLLQNAPWLTGTNETRRYLLLFQNDGELRPTGGFITAYAVLEVDKGKVKPVLSEDIYALDGSYKPTMEAPEALQKYVPFPYKDDPRWRLRDMNLSPDFAMAMEIFSPEFQSVSKLKYDGIIAVDTELLVKMLKVLGPVGVSGWGNFSAEPDSRCDGCPQVVYELEKMITKPLNRIVVARKAIIGPLMHSILANAFGSPKEKLPGLFEAAFSSVKEKHALFYFPDDKIQSAAESFNIAGRIKGFEGDYLHVNNTNFAGAKVNMFIKEQVEQKYEVSGSGEITKTVTLSYKNPSPPSDCNLERGGLCLNAPYRDWVRIYVPKDSTLIESVGFEEEIKTYEELDKTVFEGFFGDKYPLRPQGQAKVSFKYKLPFSGRKGSDLQVLLQKQPGTKSPLYILEAGGHTQEFELKEDKELRIRL
ncbi:MAG: DUF4012 domain-containing protein [bacterium]|nr:DUF4012 domain-containing protein [bacterium]